MPFKKIFVEITNRCNLACSFCVPSRRPAADMPVTTFARVVAELAAHTRHLCLHLLGEPLLHPQLGELLGLCAGEGLQVNLTSNGTLLAQRLDALRSPALRQFNLSLHSLAPLDAPRRMAILHALRTLHAAGSVQVSLRLWSHGTLAEPLQEELRRQVAEVFALPAPLPDGVTPGHGVRLAPRLALSCQEPFTWPHNGVEIGTRGRCRALRDHVGILVDGTVVPCCLDAEGDIPLGNLQAQSLATILASPRAAAMRDGFARQTLVEPLCRRCDYRLRFDAAD